MTFFVVEKDIPFPRPNFRNGGVPSIYCWERLEIGDSVLVGTRNMARVALQWAHRHGCKFVSQKGGTGNERGWRVWRIS
jgi:hypothetical protein